MQNDQRGSSGYAGSDSERPEGEQDDRDAWGEYPGQFGGEYDDAERRFGPRSTDPERRNLHACTEDGRDYATVQRDYAAGGAMPRREVGRTIHAIDRGLRRPGYAERTHAGGRGRGFRGKGPRGYVRSDERIREDVCERLTEADLDVSDVEVLVTKSEVTLTGSVPDRATKRDIEGIAERVSGVSDIANQLRVRGLKERGESETSASDANVGSESGRPKSE